MTNETLEWMNQQIFAVLAKFIPHLAENAPIERLQSIFPHFRDCIGQILQDVGVCEKFYSPKCRILFGQVVHSLLVIFEQKRNDKTIRLEAASLLRELFAPRNSKCSESASIAFILPGVVTRCTSLIRSESSQFVEPALNVIQKIVVSVFNDKLVQMLRKVPDNEMIGELALQRDQTFFTSNAERIVNMLQILVQFVAGSQSERDRMKLLELIEDLAKNCDSTFSTTKFAQLRLQLAVRLSCDDWKQIQSTAELAIKELAGKRPDQFFEQAKLSINSYLANVLEGKANSLDSLQMLSQFMNVLNKDQMRQLFKKERESKNMFKRLRTTLESCVDIDLKRIVICKPNTTEKDILVSIPLKDSMKAEYLDRILTALVKNGMGKKMFRYIANSLRSKPASKRIAPSLIMAHLCKALKSERQNQYFVILIQNHLTCVWLKHLNMFVENAPDPSNSDPIETSSLWHTRESAESCALLASLSYSMQVMNPKRRDFQRLIIDVLYTILQFLPSTNMACSSAAHVTLEIIANTCNQTTSQFLAENADKIVFKSAMQTRNLKKYPRSPFALAALLDRGYGREMVDDLANLIPELLNGISTEDSARLVPCLKAMHCFVVALTKWFPELLQARPVEKVEEAPDLPDLSSESDSDQEGNEMEGQNWERLERLREKFEHLRQKNTNAEEDFRPVAADEKAAPPKLVKCVYRILERIQHLHHCSFPYTRLLLADLLCDSLRFIRQFENQLLPMIHQNWVPMSVSMRKTLLQTSRQLGSQNLSTPNKLIVAAELRTVSCMCEVGKSFLYSKIANELDEPLHDYMCNVSSTSQKTAAVYSHSSSYKLQAAIFECWPIYCKFAGVSTERALRVMHIYADDKLQNSKLRELASIGIEKLAED